MKTNAAKNTNNSEEIRETWERLRGNQADALSQLFRQTSDLLFRYGSKFYSDQELVKDCIQELFVKLHQTQNELPTLKNPLFYLFRVLKNILFNAIRQRAKLLYLSPQDLPFQAEFYFEPEEKDDENLEETSALLEQLFSCLSNRQKEAIYLRYQMDMSYEEIAQLLEINYQSARNLVHRALEKIRAEKVSIWLIL
ncbi:MAG: sigma-70 family RNA polymerase sigma factor [Massilibacteroides sp.]|nr:sigma-70 family RNA polymerase sigma factor [Massilibacteroides sp.]MDD3063314.1 sigma-70 family RNA polymerase sigma factor [Massilibacteroides sp.]MDD4115244.1 sigma-70 family RNA polymerase sigma factor [Massilibacteroides sp.]MDD4661261.1 sigma-70 family RNA polymerase sigma factor [Massilibacteroides sp.]